MIPSVIVKDEEQIDSDGVPIKGASIYSDHIRVHPDYLEKTKDGLEQMFGSKRVFTVMTMEEYKEIKNDNIGCE